MIIATRLIAAVEILVLLTLGIDCIIQMDSATIKVTHYNILRLLSILFIIIY
jgi:hypothetical protein